MKNVGEPGCKKNTEGGKDFAEKLRDVFALLCMLGKYLANKDEVLETEVLERRGSKKLIDF